MAQFAAQLGVSSAPHNPMGGPLPIVHFSAVIEKPAPFLEWNPRLNESPAWIESPLEIKKGAVALPKGASWRALR